jgi:hypothetical protein
MRLVARLRRWLRPRHVGVLRPLPHVRTCPRRAVDLWFGGSGKKLIEDQPETIVVLPHIPEGELRRGRVSREADGRERRQRGAR